MQGLLDVQKELQDRLASKGRAVIDLGEPAGSQTREYQDSEHPHNAHAGDRDHHTNSSKGATSLEEVHFSMQKLKREILDLKAINAKLVLTNSQLEDDVKHVQLQYEGERRAHMEGKKLYLPKVQKVIHVLVFTVVYGVV